MDMLQVRGNQIVDSQGLPVRLRGTCVGGWMNMENFIDGYPGAEAGLRAAMAEELGPAKARFFFERLLDHFFSAYDIAYLADCGVNCVRLPLNYRHFEDDAAPGEYLEAGFARLDQVLDWCGRHGVYAILDLHAVQGGQNPDWHCDNACGEALFWQYPHFQERFYGLWEEFARRYQGNPVVAGYNVMNEPVTGWPHGRTVAPYRSDWELLNHVYREVVRAIRIVDPQHILFLEGDFFSQRFAGLEAPYAENLAYSSHHYTAAGFGPGRYPGKIQGQYWDPAYQRELFARQEGTIYAREHNVPLWVGEFGSVYNGPEEERAGRLQALDDEIAALEEAAVHWTTWTYKDVGVMGWVTVDPESEYMEVIRPVLELKLQLGTDLWGRWLPPTPARSTVQRLAGIVARALGKEVDPKVVLSVLDAAILPDRVGAMLQPAYARCFRGMSELELDRTLGAFAFDKCQVNEGVAGVIRKHLQG
jgi:endoglucanase